MTTADASEGRYYGINDGKYILVTLEELVHLQLLTPQIMYGTVRMVFFKETGINNWNNRYYAKFTDNASIVTIDQPISLTYSFETTDDLNKDFTSAPFEFTWKKELYSTGGYDNITGTTTYLVPLIIQTLFLNTKVRKLWGFPEKNNEIVEAANPIDGTQLVNADTIARIRR